MRSQERTDGLQFTVDNTFICNLYTASRKNAYGLVCGTYITPMLNPYTKKCIGTPTDISWCKKYDTPRTDCHNDAHLASHVGRGQSKGERGGTAFPHLLFSVCIVPPPEF